MTITEIKKAFPEASDVTVAEIWLRDIAREAGVDLVEAEFGFSADKNGEFTLTPAEADVVLSA